MKRLYSILKERDPTWICFDWNKQNNRRFDFFTHIFVDFNSRTFLKSKTRLRFQTVTLNHCLAAGKMGWKVDFAAMRWDGREVYFLSRRRVKDGRDEMKASFSTINRREGLEIKDRCGCDVFPNSAELLPSRACLEQKIHSICMWIIFLRWGAFLAKTKKYSASICLIIENENMTGCLTY